MLIDRIAHHMSTSTVEENKIQPKTGKINKNHEIMNKKSEERHKKHTQNRKLSTYTHEDVRKYSIALTVHKSLIHINRIKVPVSK